MSFRSLTSRSLLALPAAAALALSPAAYAYAVGGVPTTGPGQTHSQAGAHGAPAAAGGQSAAPAASANSAASAASAAGSARSGAAVNPPGRNGTVKIHDIATGTDVRANQPHVCAFYLDGFGFDSQQDITWWIEYVPPLSGHQKGEDAARGVLRLDASGHGVTQQVHLQDGHYKLYWDFDSKAPGQPKHKVFWVDCGNGSTAPSPAPSSASGPVSPVQTPPAGEKPVEGAPDNGFPAAASPAAARPAGGPSAAAATGQHLAETGASGGLGAAAGAAVLALVAGGLLLRRNRAARRG